MGDGKESILVNEEDGDDLLHYKHGWTFHLFYCTISAVIGSSFVYGYTGVMVNEPYKIFEGFINKSYAHQHNDTTYLGTSELNNIWTLAVSLFLVGGIFGSLLGGSQAKRFGRRKSLMCNCVLGIVGGGLMFSAPFVDVFELILVGRAIAGFYCGLITSIVPVFVTELAPLSLRGAVGTLSQISISSGGMVASVLGLPVILGRVEEPSVWPFLFFPCLLLPIVQVALLVFTVESPRWLMVVKLDESAAFSALTKLRGSNIPFEVLDAEMAYLRNEKEVENSRPKLPLIAQLRGAFSWPLVICIVMQLTQQFSGINAAIFYSSEIFVKAGLVAPIVQYASLGVISTSTVMGTVSSFVIERVGRRVLMIAGISGMLLSSGLITVFLVLGSSSFSQPVFDYLTIVFLILFVASFAIGPGPIPWFITPELSLPQFRPISISICTFVNWICNLAVAFGFPPVNATLGPYSFLPFFAMLTLFDIFTILFLPETRGETPENSINKVQTNRIQCHCASQSNIDQLIER